MHTEEEAKKLWCPQTMSRMQSSHQFQGYECTASECMAWRWHEEVTQLSEEGQGGDLVLRLKRKKGEPKLGYCGIAGKP